MENKHHGAPKIGWPKKSLATKNRVCGSTSKEKNTTYWFCSAEITYRDNDKSGNAATRKQTYGTVKENVEIKLWFHALVLYI